MLLIPTLLALLAGDDVPAPAFSFEALPEPVLPVGEPGEWDSSTIWGPQVVQHDGAFHMFYSGNYTGSANPWTSAEGLAIGYAISDDGVDWEKSAVNPILRHVDDQRASVCAVFVEDDTWYMLYNHPSRGFQCQENVFLATAKDPEGPWKQSGKPVLTGQSASFAHFVIPHTLLKAGDEYRFYFTGMDASRSVGQFGLATAQHPTRFELHPGGLQPRPVLARGERGQWDPVGMTGGAILPTETGWQMFFVGYNRPILTRPAPGLSKLKVGYATSTDGVTWTRTPEGPAFELPETGWPLLHVVRVEDEYLLYHDKEWGTEGIALMRGTIEP